jgi:pyrroline-5-carboxylate reductase
MKIGFVGGGNMAEAMLKGMISEGIKDVIVSEPGGERRQYLEKTFGVQTTDSNKKVGSECGLIILAVKPQNMEEVLSDISDTVTEEKTVMSIAAGIKLDYISSRLNTKHIIRVMPNTPALVQEGMSVMSLCECFSGEGLNVAKDILMSIGKVITLPEKHMDAVTALSGSGPGFIAYFVEAMIEGGTNLGLTEDDARTLAVQTLMGTAGLLDTGMPPSRLREMVTSPGGTTAAGLNALEKNKFKHVVNAALEAARDRGRELGRRSE